MLNVENIAKLAFCGWPRTGRPASRRRRLPVTVFLGAEHDVGLFADRTRLG
jgi:hypothetical protein